MHRSSETEWFVPRLKPSSNPVAGTLALSLTPGHALRYVKNQTEEMCMIALQNPVFEADNFGNWPMDEERLVCIKDPIMKDICRKYTE